MPKDKIVQALVTSSTRQELEHEAQNVGLSLSAYVRTIILSRRTTPIYTTAENIEQETSR